MRDEFVRRRAWMDDAAFVDLLGAANLIPGPTSTELAMHLGYRRAGWAGLAVAGLAFLLPAVAIVAVLAWIYVTYGTLPVVGAVFAGVAPVVVAIVAHAGWAIGRTAIRTPLAAVIALVAAVGAVGRVSEILLLLGLGAAAVIVRTAGRRVGRAWAGWPIVVVPGSGASWLPDLVGPWLAAGVFAIGPGGPSPLAILGEFAKIGSVLFGSGYVLVALLRSELVEALGWITESQLIDAIAVGQGTPGPLFSTATFIGFLVDGPIGATAATVGIFAPAFVAVAISIPILERLLGSTTFRAFLDGVSAAAVGLLVVVAIQLAIGTLTAPLPVAIAIAVFLLLMRGIGTGWLVAAGAIIGVGTWLLQP